jgi:hypothetical protein
LTAQAPELRGGLAKQGKRVKDLPKRHDVDEGRLPRMWGSYLGCGEATWDVGKLPGVPSYGLKWSYAGNRRGGLVPSLHRNRGEMGRVIGARARCAKERKGGGGPGDNWSRGLRTTGGLSWTA